MLFINVKDTIFESKSQRINAIFGQVGRCLSMSKIQFLKANHNSICFGCFFYHVVYQCQRYNFWKQITTLTACFYSFWSCLSMSKIQFLKANHNHISIVLLINMLFINVKDTIFESKSQRSVNSQLTNTSCLSMSKIQFLKANHNASPFRQELWCVVYQCQRYNFWKQITTLNSVTFSSSCCLSMSKIQLLNWKRT